MGFSVPQQIFLFATTIVFVYQMMVIAGKMGIVPLGRFATFVMVPAMFLFNINSLQIVLVATFVEVAGGVAADVLFGRKVAQLSEISSERIKKFQLFGLLISSLCVGGVFWALINYLELGSDALFAYKAQNRQILIDVLLNCSTFNGLILLVGAVFSYLLKLAKVNPILVLGGILMPLNLSLGLVFGGFLTLLVKKREDWEPFWSGIFASNSIWMIFQSLVK